MDRYEKALELARAYYDKDANAFLDTIFPELKESEEEKIRKAIIKSLDMPFPEDNLPGSDVTYEEAVAWLEKQKDHFRIVTKMVEQKPAVWDEEDEKILERFLGWLQGSMGEKTYSLWLKSLRDRFNLQPKQEWSEEDEKHRQWILECLADGKRKVSEFAGQYQAAFDWLKSLRPQQKVEWSEEDSKRYVSIGTTLETSVVLSKEDYDANMSWLHNLVNSQKYSHPQPSWKPSEEQMGALSWMLENARGNIDFDPLKNLYKQLKKLM